MKRNSNNGFVKVPNRIIGKLKRNHCSVYLYLLYLCTVQGTNTIKVKAKTIAQALGIKHRETVSRELKTISKSGFIKTEDNYATWGEQRCNIITVFDYDPQADYFLLPSKHILLGMSGVAVELMCVLYSFAFANSYAMPSLSAIKKVSGMGNASIFKGIAILEENNIIVKKNYIKQDGSFGNNRYFFNSKIEKNAGEDRAAKFIVWLRGLTFLFCESWQCLKDIVCGNYSLIDQLQTTPQENSAPTKKGMFARIRDFAKTAVRKVRDFFVFCGRSVRKITPIYIK